MSYNTQIDEILTILDRDSDNEPHPNRKPLAENQWQNIEDRIEAIAKTLKR